MPKFEWLNGSLPVQARVGVAHEARQDQHVPSDVGKMGGAT